jgi:putative phage-type endonuclease
MRTNITGISHDDFLKLRTGIGGSDAGSILGLSEYVSRYELWGIKAGLYEGLNQESSASFFGRFFESAIADLYTYWGGDFESLMANHKDQKRVNEIEPDIYHYIDDENPFLQCSPDRIILSNYKHKGQGVLEVKTILGFVADKYEAGIPPMYYAQMQHNMMVTGLGWGDFVILKDGRNFDVFHIERNDDFIADLKKREIDFWARVIKTREAVARNESYEAYEPEIDGTEAFAHFLKRQYQGKEETIYATPEDKANAETYDICNKQIKEIEKKKQLAQNSLMFKMKDATVMIIDDFSKITYRPDVRGTRRFVLKYK